MTKNKQTFSIRETANILVPDKLGRTSYLVGLLMAIIMLVGISLLYSTIPGVVPLYFTLPWGETRLAPKYMLYMLPAISIFFMVVNLMLGRLIAKLSALLPRALAIASATVVAMLLISLIGIVQSLIL